MAAPPRIVTADRGDGGRRLDLVLRRRLTDIDAASRTRIQAWIEEGRVTLNGVTVRRVSTRAALGDLLAVTLPDEAPRRSMTPEDINLDILFEDDHLIAIDKPAGMVVHPGYRNTDRTLMNALLWRARAWPAHERPSIVGRLDKLTSGIVIAAKTRSVHAALQRAMASSVSEKHYLAVVFGRVGVARGRISLKLSRDRRDRRRVVASHIDGAPSLTVFERLAHAAGLSLLRCRLITGRMHQIRVHLAARGWPIVGDPTYGEPRWTTMADQALASVVREFPRQALHAWRVTFPHPSTGRPLTLEASIPPDLDNLLVASGLSARYDTRAKPQGDLP